MRTSCKWGLAVWMAMDMAAGADDVAIQSFDSSGTVLFDEVAKAAGAVIHVDGANASGRMEGSATYPYATIGQALVTAQSGDTIKVAQGVYAENLVVDLPLSLIGGFTGGSSNAYATGSGGDFTASLPVANPTRIQGSNTTAVVRFGDVTEGRLEGLILSGGSRGVLSDGWVAVPGILSILHCIVEDNGSDENPDGLPGRDWYGGGLCLGGQHAELINCIIRNNRASKGAGLNTGRIQCLIEGTLIENNIGSSDHGGGAFVSGQATIRNSVFRGNVIGVGYGWGGGLVVNSASNQPVLIEGCVFTDNSAPSYGSGLFLDDGSVNTVRNCLIYKNRASTDGGALAVDGMGPTYVTAVAIENCTLADNLGDTSSAILTDSDTAVSVKNCILSGHTTNVYDRRQVNNTLTVSYSSTQHPMPGTGNIEGDSLFVDGANSNYHLAVSSPCINAGTNETWMQTATDQDGNPRIRRGRVDMGAYESDYWGVEGDADGDGFTDDTEINITGTDPTNPLSFLGMSGGMFQFSPDATGIVVCWQSVTGKRYRLERSTNLVTDSFSYSMRTNILGMAPINTEIDTTAVGSGPYHYRVGVE